MCGAAPQPFEWTYAIAARPYMAEKDLKNPNRAYHIIKFITLQTIEHPKCESAKDDSTNDALHEVVGKR